MMDQSFKKASVQQRDLQVLNQREDRDLQHKLNMLDKQYRYTRKMLQQRRESLIHERRRVVMVKVVEPKATVNVAMKDIGEHTFQTSYGRRSYSSTAQYPNKGCELVEQSRSTSAPPPSVKPPSPVRRRGYIQSSVSLMQMKNIATIDSISEKELARQQQKAREEMERQRQFQRETLHKRVAAFIDMLQGKGTMEIHVKPP
ncbi:uncharacterized protein LOC117935754 [Etheostoma cragini]|uniref:uncharacterized protein LOC117935754 n=1 Tax=Etheostoma cragini TaxID=417921 RepID=UPI00155DE5C2|nr:uncharacterized protein LOC117935754 [Etheostoma cragini]